MNHAQQIENFPESLNAFCEKYNHKRYGGCAPAGAHNIYHLQIIDADGNVTSERFAMNLLTNDGFNRLSGSDTNNYGLYVRLWIGKTPDGQQLPEPAFTDTTLTSRITTIRAVDYNDQSRGYVNRQNSLNMFAMQFDRDSGLIYQRSTIGTFMYDYNPSGFPDSVDISEVGLTFYMNDYDWEVETHPLSTKATVVDENGDPAPITKNKDQRLIITVYFSAGIYASTINDLWSKGIYMVICPAILIWPATSRGILYGVYSNYFQGNCQLPNFYTASASEVNSYTGMKQRFYDVGYMGKYCVNEQTNSDGSLLKKRTHPISDVLFENRHEYVDGIWIWDNNWRFSILDDHDKLETPEELVSTKVYTNSPTDMSLSKTFALPHQDFASTEGSSNDQTDAQVRYLVPKTWYTHYGELPVVDFNMTSSYMYNHVTKDWDIPDNFINAPNAWYGNSFIVMTGAYLTDHNNVNRWCAVFINSHTDIPITAISVSVSNVRIVATNAYWDPSQWHEISDINHISSDDNGFNCQTARYYIDITDKARYMIPTRNQTCHRYVPAYESRTINITPNKNDGEFNDRWMFETYRNPGHKMFVSDKNNWIAGRDYVVYPDLTDTTGASDKSIFLCDCDTDTYYQTNDTKFYGNPIYRFATDDFIVIMHYANNKYGTDGQYRRQHQRFRVFRLYDNWNDTVDDPSNPTGIKDVYDMEFPVRANTSTTSIDRVWLSWSSKGYLVASDTDGDKSTYCLSLYSGQDGYTPEVFKIPNAIWGYAIDRTSRVVYQHQDDNQTMSIYDLETRTVIDTFTIPDGYTKTARVTAGFGDYIYFTVTETSSGSLSTFVYLMNEHRLVHMPDWDDVALHVSTQYAHTCQNIDGAYAVNGGSTILAFDDFMITSSSRKIGDYCYTYTYVYRSTDPTNPKNLAGNYITSSEMRAVKSYKTENQLSVLATCRDSIVLTPDGKHLLWLTTNKYWDQGLPYWYNPSIPRYASRNYFVIDIGYLLDGNTISDIPEYQSGYYCGHGYNGTYTKSGGMAYWHNGIVTTDCTGLMIWYPLEGWLAHKVTGTTRTIQSYNNPRRISGKTFTYYLSNGTVDPGV